MELKKQNELILNNINECLKSYKQCLSSQPNLFHSIYWILNAWDTYCFNYTFVLKHFFFLVFSTFIRLRSFLAVFQLTHTYTVTRTKGQTIYISSKLLTSRSTTAVLLKISQLCSFLVEFVRKLSKLMAKSVQQTDLT